MCEHCRIHEWRHRAPFTFLCLGRPCPVIIASMSEPAAQRLLHSAFYFIPLSTLWSTSAPHSQERQSGRRATSENVKRTILSGKMSLGMGESVPRRGGKRPPPRGEKCPSAHVGAAGTARQVMHGHKTPRPRRNAASSIRQRSKEGEHSRPRACRLRKDPHSPHGSS